MLAPFALLPIGARLLVPRMGVAMAHTIAAMAAWALVDGRVVQSARRVAPSGPGDACCADAATVPHERTPAAGTRRAPVPRAGRPSVLALERSPATLLISADKLLRLSSRELYGVAGTTVAGAIGPPSGVSLSGVGALGVGLSDGDVLTSIEGRSTATAEDATAAGMAAWSAGRHTVHATIVRAGETIAVTVEIPGPGIGAFDAGAHPVYGSTEPVSGSM